jgi:hypothetical protein
MPAVGGVQCERCLRTAVPVLRKYWLGTDLVGDIFEEECQLRAAESDRLRPVSRFKAAKIRRWHSKDFAAIRELGHLPVSVWSGIGRYGGERTWAEQKPNRISVDEEPNRESPITVSGPTWYAVVGLILIAAGLALYVWTWVEETQGRQPVYFVSTPGEIVSLSPGGGDGSVSTSRIRVTVGGREIEFKSRSYASDGLGKWVPVWYDPADPEGTVQTEEDRQSQNSLARGVGGLAVLLGIVFIYWFRMRYSPTHFEDKRQKRLEDKERKRSDRSKAKAKRRTFGEWKQTFSSSDPDSDQWS